MGDTGGTTSTATIMFTDLVDSTGTMVRLGEQTAKALRRTHDELLISAVQGVGGHVVKRLGDGLNATFTSAVDAVAAAVRIQQSAHAHNQQHPEQPLQVRIGLSAGDVVWDDDGDCFGRPVVEAARLCAAAVGGVTLANEVVWVLARGRSTASFEPVGRMTLKGLPDDIPVCRVLWAAEPGVPLPPVLASVQRQSDYVGRAETRDRLRTAWQGVRAGGCHTVLLAGEPGVGKTRTAAEFALEAHRDGALVLYGGSDEDLSVPYQPFIEALTHYATHVRPARLGKLPGELRRLVPELDGWVHGLPGAVTTEPRTEEYRLFESIASWLVAASAEAGLVLVLDDLQWVGKPSLLALGHAVHVAAADASARLLIVGTYRDSDLGREHPLVAFLAELGRVPGVDRLPVRGLPAEEVLELVESAAGRRLDDARWQVAQVVQAQTGGNPFFVGELLRHLVETGAVDDDAPAWLTVDPQQLSVPAGVRDVVGRRIARMSEETSEALHAAAVLGRDFDVAALAAVTELPDDRVLDLLDTAVRASLVDEVGPDEFRFSHALVQEALADELTATRRRRLHRRIVSVMEQLRPQDVVALAYHSERAGPEDGSLARVARYVLAAARQAQEVRALADAEARFRQVIALSESDPSIEPGLVTDAVTGLGESLRDQGISAYRETLVDAARRADGDAGRLAAAVLANRRSITSVIGEVDTDRVELAERALAAIGAEPTAERARLLAYLAGEIVFTADSQRRFALVDEAEAIARDIGEARLLADVLVRTGFPATVYRRQNDLLARSREAVELADQTGDPVLRVEARTLAAWALLTSGDIPAAEVTDREATEITAQFSPPTLRWIADYCLLPYVSARGEYDAATEMNDALLSFGAVTGEPDRFNWWAAAGAAIAILRGTVGELADAIGQYADLYPTLPTWRSAHVLALVEAGRLADARDVLERSVIDPRRMDNDPYGLVGLDNLGRIAWALGDVGLADRLVATAEPIRHLWAHLRIGVVGPLRWSYGTALLTLGRHEQGLRELETAEVEADTRGCPAVGMRIRLDRALGLLHRDGAGDRERAGRLLQDVITAADRFGAQPLAVRARAAVPLSVS